MTGKAQSLAAGSLAVLATLILTALLYFVYFFPRTLAVWVEQGQALSITRRVLVHMSTFCSAFALLLFPLLLAGFVGCILWVLALKSGQRSGVAP